MAAISSFHEVTKDSAPRPGGLRRESEHVDPGPAEAREQLLRVAPVAGEQRADHAVACEGIQRRFGMVFTAAARPAR